jgi:hypothetical protein
MYLAFSLAFNTDCRNKISFSDIGSLPLHLAPNLLVKISCNRGEAKVMRLTAYKRELSPARISNNFAGKVEVESGLALTRSL